MGTLVPVWTLCQILYAAGRDHLYGVFMPLGKQEHGLTKKQRMGNGPKGPTLSYWPVPLLLLRNWPLFWPASRARRNMSTGAHVPGRVGFRQPWRRWLQLSETRSRGRRQLLVTRDPTDTHGQMQKTIPQKHIVTMISEVRCVTINLRRKGDSTYKCWVAWARVATTHNTQGTSPPRNKWVEMRHIATHGTGCEHYLTPQRQMLGGKVSPEKDWDL